MIRKCSTCGTSNRVPAAQLTRVGRCGKCKAELPVSPEPLEVTTEEFRSVVAEASAPILVDFWADWCGPCKMAAPFVAQVARELVGRALVLKVDVDQNQELAREFQVTSIPTFMTFRSKKLVQRVSGLINHQQMRALLESAERS